VAEDRFAGSATGEQAADPVSHLPYALQSQTRLAPRLGTASLAFGALTALDGAGALATVRLLGAAGTVLGPIPVSLPLLPSLVVGSVVLVLLADQNDPLDAIVLGVQSGLAPLQLRAGQVTFAMNGVTQHSVVAFPVALPSLVTAVFASTDTAGYLAQVTSSATSGLTVQCSVGVAGTPAATVTVSWLALGS
jgi:hypothetical protein